MHFLMSIKKRWPNHTLTKRTNKITSSYKRGDLTTSQNQTPVPQCHWPRNNLPNTWFKNQRHKQTPSTFNAGTWSRLALKAVMRSSVAFTSVSMVSLEVAPRRRTWEYLVGKPKKYREIWGVERWIGECFCWLNFVVFLKCDLWCWSIYQCFVFGKNVGGAYPLPRPFWMDHWLGWTKHETKGIFYGS